MIIIPLGDNDVITYRSKSNMWNKTHCCTCLTIEPVALSIVEIATMNKTAGAIDGHVYLFIVAI